MREEKARSTRRGCGCTAAPDLKPKELKNRKRGPRGAKQPASRADSLLNGRVVCHNVAERGAGGIFPFPLAFVARLRFLELLALAADSQRSHPASEGPDGPAGGEGGGVGGQEGLPGWATPGPGALGRASSGLCRDRTSLAAS